MGKLGVKAFIGILILTFSLSLVCTGGDGWAQIISIAKKKAGGGPDAYYYGVGSDNYASNHETEAGWAYGDTITAAAAGSVTKIRFKVGVDGNTDVKIMLVTGASTVHECQTIASANIAAGWNEVTLATPYTIAASESVKVFVGQASSYTIQVAHDGTGTGGLLDTSHAYATFCNAAPDGAGDARSYGVSIYVD